MADYDLLIRNCSVLRTSPDSCDATPRQDILVRGDRIAAITPTGTVPRERAERLLEARGQLAMPGFVNTHAHVPMVIFRGLAEDVDLETWFNEYMWPLESNLTEEDVYWGMLLGLAEMIEAGVTSVADHYFYMDRAAEAVERAGVRALLGWAVFGDGGEEAVERSLRFATRWQGAAGGRIRTCAAPHAPYTCPPDFLRYVTRRARELDLMVHIHAAETLEQCAAQVAATGQSPIQLLEDCGLLDQPTIVAHACGASPDDAKILARHRAGVAHAPKTYLKLAMGAAPLRQLQEAGVPIGLASDGAVSNNTLDLWESLRLMAMVQKHEQGRAQAMPVHEALWIATQQSAQVFGLGEELGQLEAGRLADLILVDTEGLHLQPLHRLPASLVYSSRASDVRSVVVGGKILMQERSLCTLDRYEILSQVRKSMERLAQRVPKQRIQLYRP